VYEPSLQVSSPQVKPGAYVSQAPVPSQRPSVPQLACPLSTQIARGSLPALATLVQRPRLPCSAQLRQAPSQVVSQHTPSTQLPEAHSVPAMHTSPSCLSPLHCLALPPGTATHGWPAVQSASVSHETLQAPSEHLKGAQFLDCASAQVPAPSQLRALESIESPTQVASLQTVVLAGKWAQVPALSHSPVRPQVMVISAAHPGSDNPGAVSRHRPTEPVWLQD